jgi:glycosyltransferase involved in cell wall biosynthesis
MKILIAVHHFPPRYTGGAEWETYRIAATLQARGHQVKVICVERVDQGPKEGVTWVDDVYEGISVRRLTFNQALVPDPVRWEYDNLWIGENLEGLITDFKPDVFHLISGYLISGRSLCVAHDLGIPTVVSLMDFWFLCPRISMLRGDGHLATLPINPATCAQCLATNKRRYKILGNIVPGLMENYWRLQKSNVQNIVQRQNFLQKTLSEADVIIGRSKYLCSTYEEAGIPSGKIIFSRQGLDFAELTPEKVMKSPSKLLRVGYLGQIARLKGVHVLLEAARRLPGAQMQVSVYGDVTRFPNYSTQLKRIIGNDRRLTLAGTYHGREDLTRLLREIDVIVVPSLWYENSPNVILEAFAHQTPVIASNLGGMAELVQHGENGLVFEVGNPDDLARQLQRLSVEPDLLAKLQTGIGPIKSVSMEIDELEAVYQKLLSGEKSYIHNAEPVNRLVTI